MRRRKKMIYAIIALLAIAVVYVGAEFWVAIGQTPKGERLERIKQSEQWEDGAFKNQEETPQMTGDKGALAALWDFLFKKVENLNPNTNVPVVKTNLLNLDRNEELVVWLGHSTLFVQTGGKRILFDPVLTNKLPVWLFMRPFKATDAFTTEDIPAVDYLVITHDHWDHLDYKAVKALKDKVGHVVCGLGVGQHFEYWGYPASKITEADWNDSIKIDTQTTLHCLPARHFSGRFVNPNQTLWTSWLIDGKHRIFVSGDGGYDGRFKKIGEQFPNIDLAVMENGQYDKDWRYIHTMPNELPQEIDELGARRVITYHNSKFALAKHAWTAPMDSILKNSEGKPWQLLTPKIGEPVQLNLQQHFERWW